MRLTHLGLALVMSSSMACLAQEWEVGAGAGYGWYLNPTISGPLNSGRAGYRPRAAFGVLLGENMYNYIGGEFQYLFRFGGTQLQSDGITENSPGYTNIFVYNLMVHMTPRESKFRPFVAAGAGIKVYTNSDRVVRQPLAGLALLLQGTQVEPAISLDGGLKCMLPRHVQLRLDFRVYTTPTPDLLIRPVGLSRIQGWVFDLVPMAGVSYVF